MRRSFKSRILKPALCAALAASILCFTACNEKTVAGEAVFVEKTVGAPVNTDEYAVAKSYETAGAKTVGFKTLDDAFFALENKKVDLVLTDEIEASKRVRENKRFEIKTECSATENFCVYFEKSSPLLGEFNTAIKALKNDGTLDNIRKAYVSGEEYKPRYLKTDGKKLVMATEGTVSPFSIKSADGAFSGIDVDSAKEICGYLGYSLEIRSFSFEELQDALIEGSADFYMSAALPTEERAEALEFSEPYYTLYYVAVGY